MKPDTSQPLTRFPDPLSAVPADSLLTDAANESSASVGILLRIAREKAGLSLGDVASRLRMGVKQVRALEEGDYAALPKGTFLRGFVRNFAKEVGVKPEQALNVLNETHRPAAAISASAVIMPSQQNINVPPPGGEVATPRTRFFIAAAIAVLLLTVIWWWWEYVRPYRADGGRPKPASGEKELSVSIAMPAPSANIAPTDSVTAQPNPPALPSGSQIEMHSPTPASPPVSPTSSQPSDSIPDTRRPPVSAGNGLLGLTFTDKSWVEVVDGTGKSVLDRTFKGGEAEEVIGRPPFTVVIGNARATRMAYNGKEVDLAPHTRASVARLTIK